MSTHTNESWNVCENSVSDGCSSCMAFLLRPPRQTFDGHHCPGNQYSNAAGDDNHSSSVTSKAQVGSRLVLLTVMAFVLPVVACVMTVQFIESRTGSAIAATAGLAAAGLTTVTSAVIVKRSVCRSRAMGADR